jgi:hypothetical protein
LAFELGVLCCTLDHAIDPQMSDQTLATSRRGKCSVCLNLRAYAAALRSINAGKMLPDNVALLWKVRAPVGTRASPS